MTRAVCLVCVLVLACSSISGSRTKSSAEQSQTSPAKPQAPAPQRPQQPPDETNPPEEDTSAAPRTYALDPLQSDRCIKIGDFYMHQGTPRGLRAALGRYEDATKYNPGSPEAFFKVGEAEEKLKNKDAARIAFQRVVRIAPDSKIAQEAKKKLGSKS